jgi:RimJ/RimL family protein N-acetyltransferase
MRLATPPYRVETERLVLRCWEPRDALGLKEAVDSSVDHLRPWMPWAEFTPQPLDDTIELLRTFRGEFDLGQNFVYGLFERDGSRVAGGSGLHPRVGDGGLEIGYWIRADSIGRGLAREAAAALTRVAFERCGVDRVEIRTDLANVPSMRVPLALGYSEEARLRRRLPPKEGGELRDVVVFTLFAADLPASAAASVRYEAFDAAGRPVP